jgi:hypothetical protein
MEYKYIKYNSYHIYKIINEQGHCSEVFFHQKIQKDMLDDLEKNYNATIKRANILATVLFETEEDTKHAIEYLKAYDIMRKLTK